ncbi:MAG: hypothetical protein IT462_03320 [Planctomycetes bacterium]|nr:hypothetical protein [Planctomycetota bacterium]
MPTSSSPGPYKPFVAPSPKNMIVGRSMNTFIDGVMIRGVAREILAREGLEEIDPGAMYPQQKGLDVMRRIAEKIGAETLFSIGYRVPYNAEFPDSIRDVRSALGSINPAYRLAVLGTNIGRYEFSEPEQGRYEVLCENPYPCDFDLGIVTALVERYRGSQLYLISHAPDSCRKKAGPHCRYRVERAPR